MLITVPGNHDLPMHNYQYYSKSALALLEKVRPAGICILKNNGIDINKLQVIGSPFGQLESFDAYNAEITSMGSSRVRRRVLVLHEMVFKKRRPTWAPNSLLAKDLIERYGDEFDLIVTGDNHETFTEEIDGVLLVNPGSMLRITADQADFQPYCYLYYAEENEVHPVRFPIQTGVHNREHLDKEQERDGRIAAYIEQINKDWDAGLSFRRNLWAFFEENKIPKKVREVIWEHLERET